MAMTPEEKAAKAAAKAAEKAAKEALAKAEAEAKAAADAAAGAQAPVNTDPSSDEPVAQTGGMTKAEMKEIIEAYKKSNPAKYELKKDELARKLAAAR